MNERQYHLVKVIQKIEVFRDFESHDVQNLLRICRFRDLKAGEEVYRRGEESDEMLILLRGQLRVIGTDGDVLAEVRPGMPTGEMGLFTGAPRSADIVAAEASKGIVLRSAEVSLLMSKAPQMQIKILRNVIGILSQRVADANDLVTRQQRRIQELESQQAAPGEYDDDEYDDDFDDITVEDMDD